MPELQTIPARHGVATFVPAGHVIKIINTKGTQVVDTWAFALPKPDGPKDATLRQGEGEKDGEEREANVKTTKKKKQANKMSELPSQEDAEKATKGARVEKEEGDENVGDDGEKKKGWGSYMPSVSALGLGGEKKEDGEEAGDGESEQQKNSRTWGSYFTAGKGFGSYIPKQASDTVSQFASYHERDKNKTYLQQLQDFSQTPVGAAGWKGMAAMTGSGYSGSLYAGYQAWNAKNAANTGQMEFMSMPHTRAATLHLRPQVNDTMVTNIREPILTLVEDTSSSIHDTLIAACDPPRYQGLGVPKWEEHGSCAENLVLALKELNERAGLKGVKAVGAQVTINNVPAPLNLFMNIPWDDEGSIGFMAPKSKSGAYVRFKAERDVVVVMSACPQDVLDINGKNPTDANFVVEDGEGTAAAIKRTAATAKKKPPPRRTASSGTQPMQAARKTAPPTTTLPKKAPPTASPAAARQQYTPAKKVTAGSPQTVKAVQANQVTTQPVRPAATRPKKKPVPPPVRFASSTLNGDSMSLEKKKPRKLTRPHTVSGVEI